MTIKHCRNSGDSSNIDCNNDCSYIDCMDELSAIGASGTPAYCGSFDYELNNDDHDFCYKVANVQD